MNNANISWNLPTERESGEALDVADIAGVEVSLSADNGNNFTLVNTVAPPATDIDVNDLASGGWIVRCTVIDTDDKRSSDVDTPFSVDTADPNPVTNVVVDLS